jgi:hypothetical protein
MTFADFFVKNCACRSRKHRGESDHAARERPQGPISLFLAAGCVRRIGSRSGGAVGDTDPGTFSRTDLTEWTIDSSSGIDVRNDSQLG